MLSAPHVVILLDVDNTLFDNDAFAKRLDARLSLGFGESGRAHYWDLYNRRREELGYADYLGALQEFRDRFEEHPDLIHLSSFLLDFPFAELLYPEALDAIAHLQKVGLPVVLSDGDMVFQPRKVKRSGIWDAVGGRVLIHLHKQRELESLQLRYPAAHYVMVDDKPQLLAATKAQLGERLTTIFVNQGHYAAESVGQTIEPAPDLKVECIGDLLRFDLSLFPPVASMRRGNPPPTAPSPGIRMNQIPQPGEPGQSIWLDNINRRILDDGTLRQYVEEFAISGLTSNPTIFDEAIGTGDSYDEGIREKARRGLSGEALFIELALEDLRRAADVFRPIFDATRKVDGWVSMEVSPLLAGDTAGTIAAARRIHADAARPNLYIKIPGTPEGIPAIEEAIFLGVPVNVTLLFSRTQYLAAAEAYLRGIERRIEAGLDAHVSSVASLFVSRWDKSVNERVGAELKNRLGIAVARRTYVAYRDLLDSARWGRLAASGARPQRLLFASTGTKDPAASDTLYVDALALPGTIDTMPDKTLHAYAAKAATRATEGTEASDAGEVLAQFAHAGIDVDALALQLQREGRDSFVASWQHLLGAIAQKSAALTALERHNA